MPYRTLSDLIRNLRAHVGNDTSPQKTAACRRAAFAAFRSLNRYGMWDYYQTWGRFSTVASYSVGAIVYDQASLTLTLTDGVFPTWSALGSVLIDTTIYDIQTRVDDTHLVLQPNSNPGADIAVAEGYTVFQNLYPLPADFLGSDQLLCASTNNLLMSFTSRDFVFSRSFREGPSQPREFCFFGGKDKKGTFQVAVWPPPDDVYIIEFKYQRQAATPILEEDTSGLLSASGINVTGSNTNFLPSYVGSIIRFGKDGQAASVPYSDDSLTPPLFESRILTVADATHLVMEDAAPTITNVKGLISDQLDIDNAGMWDFMIELGRKQVRIDTRMKSTDDDVDAFDRALKSARSGELQRNRTRTVAGMKRPDQRYTEYPTRTDYGN